MILRCAQSPKHEVTYSRSGRALELLSTVTPKLHRRIVPGMFDGGTFAGERTPPQHGDVFDATPGPVLGGWRTACRATLRRAVAAAPGGRLRGLLGRRA